MQRIGISIVGIFILITATCIAAGQGEPGKAAPASSAERELVALYSFDEASGGVLHDRIGHGNNGNIHGAAWIRGKSGSALRFDGLDDYVDFGAAPGLNFANAVTLSAWVYPEDVPKDHALIVGRQVNSFGLFQHTMTAHAVWWAVGEGKFYCSSLMERRKWNHLAGVFDGKTLRLYVNDKLGRSSESPFGQVSNAGVFRMGGDGASYFKGLIADVRVYDRALSDQEVEAVFGRKPGLTEEEVAEALVQTARKEALTGKISVIADPYYFDKRVDVTVRYEGLGELPEGARAEIALVAEAGQGAALQKVERPLLATAGELTVRLEKLEIAPGEHRLEVKALTREGKPIGPPAVAQFTWPMRPSWPGQTPEMKVLNNLVTELLNVETPSADEYMFRNPRKHWVFFSCAAELAAADKLRVALDSDPWENSVLVCEAGTSAPQEAMRLLSAGEHKLRIRREGRPALKRLIVRAIPELGYARFSNTPSIAQYGPYDWSFLEKHILANLNMIDGGTNMASEEIRTAHDQWKARGKRWLDETGIPGGTTVLEKANTLTADYAYQYWANGLGMKPGLEAPAVDGLLGDELHGGSVVAWAAWTEAVRRLHKEFPDKVFYPYCSPMYGTTEADTFARAIMDAGYAFAWEVYLPEAPNEFAARRILDQHLRKPMREWQVAVPGIEKHVMLNFGHWMSSPPETSNTNPAVDFKVYMDMMFNLAANDPDFFGLYGVMEYTASLADEELVRWASKLMRHYCIEGKTSMLSDTPYVLTHIRNPDFDEGTNGWTLSPAEEGSMGVKGADGLGMLQGRHFFYAMPPDNGNRFLWTKRSPLKPNLCSQEIANLQQGRLYSVKMLTANYPDMSAGQKHAATLKVDGAERIPGKSFQSLVKQRYQSGLGYFPDTKPAWFNYYLEVFRAVGPTARLTISDWLSDKDPGGAVGQEIIYNYIEVEPFLED